MNEQETFIPGAKMTIPMEYDIAALRAEVERLKKALEFYANKDNWIDICRISIVESGGYGWRPAENAMKGGSQPVCKWEHDLDRENDVWETSCDNAVVFDEGEPKEHGYKFCHYCGKPIQFVEIEKGGEG